MRELRGAGMVNVKHVGTDYNPADLFTKILGRVPFERHRRTVLNLAAHDIIETMRAGRAKHDEPAGKEAAAFAVDRRERSSAAK